ncbi:MAG: hemolysin family protein [Oscillospiraceae bacterium]|nr:hemolysin family protein [Oscillospiraceae bacterium]
MSQNLIMSISIVILVIFSAFFSAAETAFSTINKIRLKSYAKNKNPKAIIALKIAEDFDKALSAILIGSTVVNIASSTIATMMIVDIIGESGALISTVGMTFVVLTFGEILPKSFAKEDSEGFTLRTARILRVVMIITNPLVIFFLKIKKIASRFGKKQKNNPSVTEQELKHIVESIEEEGVLEKQESEMVQSALEFDEKSVGDILTPRVNMVTLGLDDSAKRIEEIVVNERYSRIPVYQNSIDNIVGILHTRDYLEAMIFKRKIDLSKMMKPCYFVYESKELSILLSDFKRKKLHVAIVVDDYGGTLGMVTMEDLLEEIVGDIWDEDEEIEQKIVVLDDFTYETSGDVSVKKLFEFLKVEEDNSSYGYSEYSTLSGLALKIFHRVPEVGETFTYSGLEIIVKEVTQRRVAKFSVRIVHQV